MASWVKLFVGLLLILIALAFAASAANAITAIFLGTNNGGEKSDTKVSFLESSKLYTFRNQVNEMIYSASAGGTSWQMQYSNGIEGFQNQANNGLQGHTGNYNGTLGSDSYGAAPNFSEQQSNSNNQWNQGAPQQYQSQGQSFPHSGSNGQWNQPPHQ